MKRMQSVLLRSTMLAGLVLSGVAVSQPALAQDNQTDDDRERIVVTGSRLRRDEFSSISPVQVIGGEESARIGVVDTTSIIAESPVVMGPQLDGSVAAGDVTGAVEGVPANGPGASTVALRGLGAERTLLMVNGRRLSPSGVRGAPVAPDLNLIPSSMIDRVEILTDGASSIYGADAVAGVANIILRQNFEGFEVSTFATVPEANGGEEFQVGFIGGASTDRSNFTVAAEFFNRTAVLAGDRDHWNDCLRDIETAPNGTIHSVCEDRRPDNAIATFSSDFSTFAFLYSTPGVTDNTFGATDFSTGASILAETGSPTSHIATYNLQDEEQSAQLLEELERINIFATGEYDVNFFQNDTIYFEMSYAQRTSTGRFPSEQVFPENPAMIPELDAAGNVIGMVDNPLNPIDDPLLSTLPVVSMAGLSQRRETDIDNFRFVGGIEGDLAFAGLADNNWVYDVFFSYEESSGTSIQAGLLETNAQISVDTLRMDHEGNLVCGIPATATGAGFITRQACPIVNWFSPTLFTTTGGDRRFATQAEEDFLFGNVINTTKIEQVMGSAVITGDVFEMPAGTVGLVLGAEFRENRIASRNDLVRSNGLAASEGPDQEGDTIGRTSLWEVYAETEIPVHEMLGINMSGRFTNDENFGEEFTYSFKADFRPTDDLRFRGTYGTTFRAPNLREQFLAGTAGVLGASNDPCIVPTAALESGDYLRSDDPRTDRVLANCIADGVDPENLGRAANVLIPTQVGGSSDLVAETSDSYTFGLVFSQPWTDDFSLDFSATYFNIEMSDTVEETNPATVLARCYNDEDGLASPFCSRITRRGTLPSTNTVSLVDASFVNIGSIVSSGIDFNVRYQDDFDFGGRGWDLAVNATATWQESLSEQVDDQSPADERVGEAGYPEWAWVMRANLSSGPWDLAWRTRWIDGFARDADDVVNARNRASEACTFLGIGSDCIKTHEGDAVWYHDASVSYVADNWTLSGGVRNILDEQPPLVDQGQAPTRMNFVVQSGYDMIGRRFFVGATRRF